MLKRGQVSSELALAVVAVAVMVVLLPIITGVFSGKEEAVFQKSCQESVEWRAATQTTIEGNLAEGSVSLTPFACHTIKKDIEGNRDQVKFQTAERIAGCWRMMGGGRYDAAFQGSRVDYVPWLLGTSPDPQKCYNCHIITMEEEEFDDTQQWQGTITEDELVSFMLENGPSWVDDEEREWNYITYIQQFHRDGLFVSILPEEGLEPGKSYTISYLPKNLHNEGLPNWLLRGSAGTATAGVAGLIVGCVFTRATCGLLKPIAGYAIRRGLQVSILAGGYSVAQQNAQNIANFKVLFKERPFSSIYLSPSRMGQQYCGTISSGGR